MKKQNKTPLGWFFEPKEEPIGWYMGPVKAGHIVKIKFFSADNALNWSYSWTPTTWFAVDTKKTLHVTKKEDIKFV